MKFSKRDWLILVVFFAILVLLVLSQSIATISCKEKGGVLVRGTGWFECVGVVK